MKMKTRSFRLCAFFLSILLFSGCLAGCGSGKARGDRPYVVATNFAVFDIARQVAGDSAEVEMLLPPETESHGYEATLADAAKIARADLFVYVGGESEDWAADLLGSMREEDRPRTLAALECCSAYAEEKGEKILEQQDEEHGEEEEPDEHVWTSFENIRAIARGVAGSLNEIDPEGTAEVEASLAAYLEKISALEAEYAAFFASTDKRFIAVADRFPFRYLAEEWDLDYVAAFSGCSSNVEASLATVNALVDAVKTHHLPAVLIIEFSDGRCASAVSRETGCAVLTLESGHNVTRGDFDSGVTLLDLMARNLGTLKTALG